LLAKRNNKTRHTSFHSFALSNQSQDGPFALIDIQFGFPLKFTGKILHLKELIKIANNLRMHSQKTYHSGLNEFAAHLCIGEALLDDDVSS
jgi:hypothetical protein